MVPRSKRHYVIIAIPSLSIHIPSSALSHSHASLPASTSFITPTARPSGRVLAFASLLIASMLASCPPPVASELTGSRCRCRCRCYFASLSPPTLHCLLLLVVVLCYVVCCAIANEQGLRCWHPCAYASGWLRHHKAEACWHLPPPPLLGPCICCATPGSASFAIHSRACPLACLRPHCHCRRCFCWCTLVAFPSHIMHPPQLPMHASISIRPSACFCKLAHRLCVCPST